MMISPTSPLESRSRAYCSLDWEDTDAANQLGSLISGSTPSANDWTRVRELVLAKSFAKADMRRERIWDDCASKDKIKALLTDLLGLGGVVTEYMAELSSVTLEILPPNMLLRQRRRLCSIGVTGLDCPVSVEIPPARCLRVYDGSCEYLRRPSK